MTRRTGWYIVHLTKSFELYDSLKQLMQFLAFAYCRKMFRKRTSTVPLTYPAMYTPDQA